jgi:hypothetical protein
LRLTAEQANPGTTVLEIDEGAGNMQAGDFIQSWKLK